jgi:hypothetical protein
MAARRFKALQISTFLDFGGLFFEKDHTFVGLPFPPNYPIMWHDVPVFLATI